MHVLPQNSGGLAPAVNIDELAEIKDVFIDTSLPVPDRKRSYINQIGNPQVFRCDDTVVRISYGDDSLESLIMEYLLSRGRTAAI
jgi:hypothetical protein